MVSCEAGFGEQENREWISQESFISQLPYAHNAKAIEHQIGDAGAQSIAQFMTKLTSLNLAYNQIGEAGAQSIAQSMTNLTSLDLSGNKITNKDLLELPSKIKFRGFIQDKPKIIEIIETNSHLTELQTLILWGKK